MMSSFFTPRGAPRHPASARALSLSLLLGLSPLAGITPAALATPTQAAPEQQAQATPASPAAALVQKQADNQQNPVAQGEQTSSLPTLRVTSGALRIYAGGTVHVEGAGFTPEFLAHHELRSLIIAPKGSSTYVGPHQEPTYQGPRFDVPAPAPDGTFSADLEVSSNGIPAGMEYEVILTYRPLDEAHPYQWNTEDRIRTALPVTNDFPASVLPSITYDVYSISEEQINSGKPIEINMTGSGFDGMNKLSFTLVEYDPSANVTHKYIKELEPFDPSDSPYSKRVFHDLIPNGHFQHKITIPAGLLKSGKGYYLSVQGDSPSGPIAMRRAFPFVPVGKNPMKMPYQSNTYRNTLPKVSLSPQTVDPYHEGKYKVTISNISPEVDLGYYIGSISVYNKTAQKTIANLSVNSDHYYERDKIVVRNPDGTQTVELEINAEDIKELQGVYLGSEAELRVYFSDNPYYGSEIHNFTVTAPVRLADSPTPLTPPTPAEDKKPDNPVGMKLTSGTLNISEGGTVSVTTAPLSAEFRAKYTLYEFGIVERGENYLEPYYGNPLPEAQYGSKVAGLRAEGKAHDNPDGSVTFTLDIPKQWMMVPEGTLFDVVLTYYPSDKPDPHDYPYEDYRLTARIPLPTVRDPEPDQPTYRYSISAIDKPWQDTTLTVEGYHILPPNIVGGYDSQAYVTLYEADPATGKIMGRPVFSHVVPLTGNCLHHCTGFRNNYFGTKMTIPAGTLKPGRLYMIGIYGSNLPHPGEEEYSGSLLTSVAQFLPVRSGQPSDNQPNPDQPVARPDLYIPYKRVNPYQEMNTLTARVSNLPKLAEGYYRFSIQATDIFGELTGEKALEQVIPAERIHDGAAEETLNVPGSALNYEGAYRVVLEKVTPGKDGAADAVEPVASENLDLLANTAEEQKAAVEWVKKQALLDESKTVLSRRDVTVALYRLAGAPHAELPATSPYADVAPNDPDYAAYIWARQKGITFGWADGKFHPEAALSTRSAVAFLYRYQRMVAPAPAPESSSVPSSSVPKNSSVPGDSPVRVSRSHWSDYERTDTAFWRESLWATQQFIWGYTDYDHRYAEGFSSDTVSSSEFSVMLYRMAHGGSRLS
ncbi:MAG: siroheme synthase [Rothia mucilaginosa]|uniref:S-layer homology domain-containing protein n=1 Tax=Rothia mucilaginosa TaxID=43675 RepID=UPI001CB3FCCD|nr:S-layer homology domain-containing protein [Rothia mucilaginosa]MBF1671554.1 siroheme synthase [Rothia mucilaginosa]